MVRHVLSSYHTALSQQRGAMLSCHAVTVAVPYKWSTGSTLHYSRLSTHLAGIKCTACPHVLEAHDGSDIRRLGNMHVCIGNMRA
jgi:hypothetical protein